MAYIYCFSYGLSDCRTIGLSDYRTVGLSECRTIGLSDYRAVGLYLRPPDNSLGPDSLHPRLLFEIKESIAEPLSIIFNQSLALKTIRKEWKNAQISAIFKKGNKSQATNYIPVSLTSVVCKIMEKLIRLHIINHMKANKLFSNKQYGFIEGRSTALQLLEVIDKWSEALTRDWI